MKSELVEVVAGISESQWNYPTKNILLKAYFAKISSGTPTLIDHTEIAWVHPHQLSVYDFAPADWKFIFLLDPHYSVTDWSLGKNFAELLLRS